MASDASPAMSRPRVTNRSTALLAATVGFGALYLAAAIALGSVPGAGAGGAAVAEWFRDHTEQTHLWVWFLTLAAPVFALFAVLVRERLPGPHRELFFFGALAFVVETSVQSWLWGAAAWHAGQLSPAAARTLLDVASYWGPVLTSTTVMMLAPIVALALQHHPVVPRWLGWIAGIAMAEQTVETVTVFGRHGFIAPGGPMNAYLGAGLVAAALLALGLALARGEAAAPRTA